MIYFLLICFVFSISDCFAQKTASGADVPVLLSQASNGDISAAVLLAKHYYLNKDKKKAEDWFEASAQAGDAEAQYFLAKIYDESREGRHPNSEVVLWFERSAHQGYIEAQVALAKIYQFGRKGIAKDLIKAKNCYEMAAAKGSREAMRLLEKMHESGIPEVTDDNVMWLDTAAKQGDAEASLKLAFLFEKGIGMPLDVKRAFELYKVAANAGIPEAQARLGNMYLTGTGVGEKNEEAGILWLEKAAFRGYVEAQRKLSEIYEMKKKDKVKAYGWMVISLSAMFPDQPNLVSVSPNLERLMRSMTEDEINQGQAYAQSLVKKLQRK